jgi:hypothetical protein
MRGTGLTTKTFWFWRIVGFDSILELIKGNPYRAVLPPPVQYLQLSGCHPPEEKRLVTNVSTTPANNTITTFFHAFIFTTF